MHDQSHEFEKALEEACEGLERCDRELAAALALFDPAEVMTQDKAHPARPSDDPQGGDAA